MPDEKGETRRQRNEKFGQHSPEIEVPQPVLHVWDWFWTLSARRRSGPESITFTEIDAWSRITRTPVRPEEVEMLIQMDAAFILEVGKEREALAERKREEAKRGRR